VSIYYLGIIYQLFNKGLNFMVISLKDGLLEASPFQQCFIRSTNNLAAGSSGDISGIGGYITFYLNIVSLEKIKNKKINMNKKTKQKQNKKYSISTSYSNFNILSRNTWPYNFSC